MSELRAQHPSWAAHLQFLGDAWPLCNLKLAARAGSGELADEAFRQMGPLWATSSHRKYQDLYLDHRNDLARLSPAARSFVTSQTASSVTGQAGTGQFQDERQEGDVIKKLKSAANDATTASKTIAIARAAPERSNEYAAIYRTKLSCSQLW